MPQTHPRYSAEFRAEAIRLVRTSGKSKTAIAHDLGISLSASPWRRYAPGCGRPSSGELDAGERQDGLTSDEVAELAELRRLRRLRRLRQLEEENQKLNQVVADLTLDNRALKDSAAKNW